MISAFVITYNSEKHIRRCLRSLSFADEIIVVDSKSTDTTLNIAREFKTVIIEHKFINFSEKKEFAKSKCKHNWILNLDADEYLPPETVEEIKRAINQNDFEAYLIPFRTYFQEKEIRYGRHKNECHIRLYKSYLKYNNTSVHEKITGAEKVGRLENPIVHTPYQNFEDIKSRAIRNAHLASKDLAKKNIFLLCIFFVFNPIFRIIKEYIFYSGFLDGKIGFYLAIYSAKEVYLKYKLAIKSKISKKISKSQIS